MSFFGVGKATAFGKKFAKLIKDCNELQAEIDFAGSYEDGTPVAQVAIWQEFGTVNIPSRPFMRTAIRNSKLKLTVEATKEFNRQLKGPCSARTIFNVEGAVLRDAVIHEIDAGHYTPNAPATVAKKGFNHPLLDTGKMRDSTTYKVTYK